MTNRAQIIGLSHDGRGIAHLDGKITFIENALLDEEVEFDYLRRHRHFDEAKAVNILCPSKDRVVPRCPYFAICGGCNLQHLNSATQLNLKQQTVLEQLQHFGNVQPHNILPPLISKIWHYRRKARLAVKYVAKKNRVLVGFHEKNGRYVAEIESCPILVEEVADLIKPLRELIESLSIFQFIPQIEVACGDNATAIVLRHLSPFTVQDQNRLLDFARRHSIQFYFQPEGIDSVRSLVDLDQENLFYKIAQFDLRINFTPLQFIQVNQSINQAMIDLALKLLDLKPNDRVLDLFCGVGNFTLPLAKLVKYVVGVEGNKQALMQADQNASFNHLENIDWHCLDLVRDLNDEFWQHLNFDKVLLDPPRTGALELIPYLGKSRATKIVYISCNSATLARDAGELVKYGYQLAALSLMDMFPHTKHVEVMALFEKN